MKEVHIDYKARQTTCKGFLVYDPQATQKLPGILVNHAWRGQDDFAREKARELARMGYVALATDYYGEGKTPETIPEAIAAKTAISSDRPLFQERLIAAYDLLAKQPQVDTKRMGCIGFCLGGLASIELLRSGADLKSVVVFHSTFTDEEGGKKVKIGRRNIPKNSSVLILHGYEDPLVPAQDLANIQKELNDAGTDWELNTYGHTSHAFMVPGHNDPKMGLVYNERTAKRAWKAMTDFFKETL